MTTELQPVTMTLEARHELRKMLVKNNQSIVPDGCIGWFILHLTHLFILGNKGGANMFDIFKRDSI
jgi:hypothetical protein